LASLILVVNVVGELQRKRTLAASRGFLAAARLSCYNYILCLMSIDLFLNILHTATPDCLLLPCLQFDIYFLCDFW